MTELKDWIHREQVYDFESIGYDGHDLLRFCRARKFVLADIQFMIKNWAKWRRDEDIDNIVVNPDFPFKDALLKAHPHGNHGVDKLGRPVWIDRVGVMDVDEMLAACSLDDSFRYEYWDYEM